MLPQNLNNVLLTLADAEVFVPIWTPELLGEVERNLAGERFGKSAQQAERRVRLMRTAFPFAEEMASGYTDLIPSMTNDPKDRHVLAAAVRSGASMLVTANLKDFPESALEKFDVEAIHPDEFLCDLLELHPEVVIRSLGAVADRNALPPRTVGELLASLERQTPRFVEAARELLVAPDEPQEEAVDHAASAFIELTGEQLAALSPEEREAYDQLQQMDHAEQVRFLGHVELVAAAWAFLSPVCNDGDLRSVWPNVDPDMRSALARQWVYDNRRSIEADRWDRDAAVSALAEAIPEHPLWAEFEREQVRSIRASVPSPSSWGIGAATRIVGPDLEVLYVHDTSTLENNIWEPDTLRNAFPMLMRFVEGRWLVRELGFEESPAPAD